MWKALHLFNSSLDQLSKDSIIFPIYITLLHLAEMGQGNQNYQDIKKLQKGSEKGHRRVDHLT